MDRTLENDMRRIFANMENGHNDQEKEDIPGTTEQETPPNETIHIHYFPDAIVILKEGEDTAQQEDNAVDTTLVQTKQPPLFIGYATCIFYLFLVLSCIAFQVYEILNPPIATVTIVPKTQTVSLTGTLQLGRLLNPTTISQSQTTPTTGKGHQDARAATGLITFYNGQLQSITVSAGTILTASNGAQVITDLDALIPQAVPPIEGQITVSAHAAHTGLLGNIPAKAINEACCALSVLAVNLTPFIGGQDERNFHTVSKSDIEKTAQPLKVTLSHSTKGAFQSQLKPNEQLSILPCTPTVTADHPIGTEAIHVTITVSQTCSAAVYNRLALLQSATHIISKTASQRLEAGYKLSGAVETTITSITIRNSVVELSVTAHALFVFQITPLQAHVIKSLIAGKTKQEALHKLRSLSGIEKVSIAWGDDTLLPKDPAYIHFQVEEPTYMSDHKGESK